jgi:hypothetical protein
MGVLIAYSSSAHRNLDLLPSREVPDRTVTRAVLLLTGLPARHTGATPRYRAPPGLERPGRTPGGGPPGQGRQGRDADTHPDRAAYREDRGRTRPRSPPHAVVRSWPHADGSRCRFAPGMLGSASDQTPLSLPPRADLTRSSGPTYGCSSPVRPRFVRSCRGGWPESALRRPSPTTAGLGAPRPPQAQSCCCSVSGRMSIRQPVSRAASRAFWPSLPIASDSW